MRKFSIFNFQFRTDQREELRVICGTRGIPGTVAPFRAWRGSRDLVAQSPKFHAPAHAHSSAPAEKILTHSSTSVALGESLPVRQANASVAVFFHHYKFIANNL